MLMSVVDLLTGALYAAGVAALTVWICQAASVGGSWVKLASIITYYAGVTAPGWLNPTGPMPDLGWPQYAELMGVFLCCGTSASILLHAAAYGRHRQVTWALMVFAGTVSGFQALDSRLLPAAPVGHTPTLDMAGRLVAGATAVAVCIVGFVVLPRRQASRPELFAGGVDTAMLPSAATLAAYVVTMLAPLPGIGGAGESTLLLTVIILTAGGRGWPSTAIAVLLGGALIRVDAVAVPSFCGYLVVGAMAAVQLARNQLGWISPSGSEVGTVGGQVFGRPTEQHGRILDVSPCGGQPGVQGLHHIRAPTSEKCDHGVLAGPHRRVDRVEPLRGVLQARDHLFQPTDHLPGDTRRTVTSTPRQRNIATATGTAGGSGATADSAATAVPPTPAYTRAGRRRAAAAPVDRRPPLLALLPHLVDGCGDKPLADAAQSAADDGTSHHRSRGRHSPLAGE